MSDCCIFFCIGSNYWPHAAVALSSLFEHNKNLAVYVFYETPSRHWMNKMARLADLSHSVISFCAIDGALVEGLKSCGHLGLSAYFRLFVPDLLPDECSRALYLDADLVIVGSLEPLLQAPLAGHIVAAVPSFSPSERLANARRLGLPLDPPAPFFNAGVLLIDLPRWRERKVRDHALDFLSQHPDRLLYADQDALSYCLLGEWLPLSPEWNVTVDMFRSPRPPDVDSSAVQPIAQACRRPRIVHFNGAFKPWHLRYKHPYRSVYTATRRSLQFMPYVADDLMVRLVRLPARVLERLGEKLRSP